jgi:multisubunit Na+/H+ antiporter MnhC subunit
VTAVAITTALNMSYMAEQLSIFGLVVGFALLLTGVGLVIVAFAVFGREAEVTERAPKPTPTAVTS